MPQDDLARINPASLSQDALTPGAAKRSGYGLASRECQETEFFTPSGFLIIKAEYPTQEVIFA